MSEIVPEIENRVSTLMLTLLAALSSLPLAGKHCMPKRATGEGTGDVGAEVGAALVCAGVGFNVGAFDGCPDGQDDGGWYGTWLGAVDGESVGIRVKEIVTGAPLLVRSGGLDGRAVGRKKHGKQKGPGGLAEILVFSFVGQLVEAKLPEKAAEDRIRVEVLNIVPQWQRFCLNIVAYRNVCTKFSSRETSHFDNPIPRNLLALKNMRSIVFTLLTSKWLRSWLNERHP